MNWASDNLGIDEYDLQTVFKYAPRESTVVQMLGGNEYKLVTSSLELEKEWSLWLSEELPPPQAIPGNGGLVLLLATRADDPYPPTASICKETPSEKPSKLAREQDPPEIAMQLKRTKTVMDSSSPKIAQGNEILQDNAADLRAAAAALAASGRRGVRTLPFSLGNFRRVSKGFHTHGTIARVISRTDVPVFSADKITMAEQPAYVYNCRSSNAWAHDMALSVTHFPKADLTFATFYGCHQAAEAQIIKRLFMMQGDAAVSHPLLLPGIFAELERQRHKSLIEKTLLVVESYIYEREVLQQSLEEGGGGQAAAMEKLERNIRKRNTWLETTYFRNGLVSWNTQLGRMADEAEALGSPAQKSPMADMSSRVGRRVHEIRNEYEDWIRDCTMRLDGMTMATQWAQNETNLEIALETKRDSKHMRSIALLTMTVFSMDFFEWKPDDEGPARVSPFIWIYFVITVLLTLGTVGLWYYFVIYRPLRRQVPDEEDDGDD
ncbi:hypothetical protein PspLS_04354 [Pyricularia sp. CBS 133598]|nr:hypothetical protein PspLS_04354 [Pyricularia sp. CBS 133598]